MTTLPIAPEELHRLESSAFDAVRENLGPTSDAEVTRMAQDWARRMAQLGSVLREHGYSRQIKDITIGRPMDLVAVEVLRLVCRLDDLEENSMEFQLVVEMLSGMLRGSMEERLRFRAAVQGVLRRLTAYGF